MLRGVYDVNAIVAMVCSVQISLLRSASFQNITRLRRNEKMGKWGISSKQSPTALN